MFVSCDDNHDVDGTTKEAVFPPGGTTLDREPQRLPIHSATAPRGGRRASSGAVQAVRQHTVSPTAQPEVCS